MAGGGGVIAVLKAAAEIAIVFAIAVFMKRARYCDETTAKKVIEMVVVFLVPNSLIMYVPRVELRVEWLVMVMAPAVYAIVWTPLFRWLVKLLCPGLQRSERGLMMLCSTGHAETLVGYPIVRGIYGENALPLCAMWDLSGFVLAYMTTYIIAELYAPAHDAKPALLRGSRLQEAKCFLGDLHHHGFGHDVMHWLYKDFPHHARRDGDAPTTANSGASQADARGTHWRRRPLDPSDVPCPHRLHRQASVNRVMTVKSTPSTLQSESPTIRLPSVPEGRRSAPIDVSVLAPRVGSSSAPSKEASDEQELGTNFNREDAAEADQNPTVPTAGSSAGSVGKETSDGSEVWQATHRQAAAEEHEVPTHKFTHAVFGALKLLWHILVRIGQMPVTYSFIAGLLMRAFSVTVDDFPDVLRAVVVKCSGCAQTITIFGLGLLFRPELLLQKQYFRRIATLMGCKYLFGLTCAFSAFLVMRTLDMDRLIPTVLALSFVMPTPPVVIAYAGEYGYDINFASMVVNSTLITSFVLAFVLAIVLPYI